MRLPVPLAAEIAAARAAGRLSRLAGAGGGTTVPGKLLWKLDPGAVDRLAARLPLGSALVSATNGKTTTAAMAAEILRPRVRLAHNRSGANLVSGVASTLLEVRDAELGLFEVDEAALPEVAARLRPRALCLGNLFRDQLDRYGELEHVAERWRGAVRDLDPAAIRRWGTLHVSARARSSSASTTRDGRSRPCSTLRIRSTACVAAPRTSTRHRMSDTSATIVVPRAGTRDRR